MTIITPNFGSIKPPPGSLPNFAHHLNKGLVAWYLANEGDGGTLHDIVGRNDGIIHGATWVGQALSFDTDYVEAENSNSLNPSKITISAWIYPYTYGYNYSSVKRYGRIARKGSNFDLTIAYNPTAGIYNGIQFGNISKSYSISLYEWQNVIVIDDGVTARIFIDGNSVASGPSILATSDTGPLVIGNYDAGSIPRYFNGIIDNVRLYNLDLSPIEVKQLANASYNDLIVRPTIWLSSGGGTTGNATPLGVSSTYTIGTVTGEGKASTLTTGVSSTYSIGTVVASHAGAGLVNVTGIESNYIVGTVVGTGKSDTIVNGINSTLALGTISAEGKSLVSVTGIFANYLTGTITSTGKADTTISGISSTFTIGTVVASAVGGNTAYPNGISSTLSVGSIEGLGKATVSISGIQDTFSIGDAIGSGIGSVGVSGISSTFNIGTIVTSGKANINVSGITSTMHLGQVLFPSLIHKVPYNVIVTPKLSTYLAEVISEY